MNTNHVKISAEAQKILELIEVYPYQGESLVSLVCDFGNLKGGYGEDIEYESLKSLVRQCIRELKSASLIFRVPRGDERWVSSRFRMLNEDFDNFTTDGKVRSILARLQIKSIEELAKFTPKDLLAIYNCGKKTVWLIEQALEKRGLSLTRTLDEWEIVLKNGMKQCAKGRTLSEAIHNLHQYIDCKQSDITSIRLK